MRLFALIKKEFLSIKNDKKSLFIIIVPPLFQIFVFSFAATTEVKYVDLAIFDRDGSSQSREFIQELKGSSYVRNLISTQNYDEAKKMVDIKKIIGFIVIPDDFAENLGTQDSKIQLILDGRRSNTAQIVESYVSQTLMRFQARDVTQKNPLDIYSRYLYNQNLTNFWWIVPNLFGSITMMLAIILSALSITREKELGTFEQILVSPLSPIEILLGKLIPGFIISILISSVILLLAFFYFGVPFHGSFLILYLGVTIFLFTISGVGLFISSICKTQQQAILGSFIFLLPSFLLSGFSSPIENMPLWLQPLSDFIPLKYYIILIKGVFLKDISFEIAIPLLVKMFLLGVFSLGTALILFKKRMK
ncbi:MAG: ABC transporter permease [Campylobacteraceae bacterium]|jgi:ABC-2 type transport system permease protein|nr:ABC transporter permease [Campylobacteraceae bacterium]